MACRGGLLARARPGDRARLHGLGSGPAASAARRRFLVASLGGPLSAPSPNAVAVAQETVQVDEDVASAEILPTPNVPVKTVHVKFVLQKQCAFGQQFLVVGDDSALGFWDPTKATALDWSEDHVWTVKKDLPASKLIEFKFLLQDPSGQVRWQHGPNRTLQITETSNTLVVYEDWDHAKNQKISEEVELSIGAEDVIFSGSNGALLADELQTDGYQETNKGVATVSVDGEKSAVVADASLHREKMGANGANQPQLTLNNDHKIPDELHVNANMVAQNGNPAATAAADYAGRNGDDSILHEEVAPVENRSASIFENDMAWPWIMKALKQFFRNLGFQIGTTKT